MKTKLITKAPLAKNAEYLIEDAPHTIYGKPSIPTSFCLTMKAGGLKKMLDKYKLDGDDTFRIEIFSGTRTSEFSFIKHTAGDC